MNLLPKTKTEFSQKEYWDTFFKKRGRKTFEWYGEYPELSKHLHKYIKQQDNVLITGCGNSTLGRDLYDLGYNKITNIDISHVVIKQMASQNDKDRPGLKYLKMDALKTSFENNEFSVVLDKGTLDALMPDDSQETWDKIVQYFNEIQRILRVNGRYICISLLQEHILKIIVDYFPKHHWMLRIVRCFEAEHKAGENGENTMPVFMVICTKFTQLPRKVFELNCSHDSRMQRFENEEDLISQISSVQKAAFICSSLKRSTISDEDEISIDLYQPNDNRIRYTVFIVDSTPNARNLPYAAFIVPQGREPEWLFSTPAGRKKLIQMTQSTRLAVIIMYRGQNYGTLEEVQDELSDIVLNLAPKNLDNRKIPFLSLGSDVGQRTIRVQGHSEISGDYIVEDVQIDDHKYRRLFYLKSQMVIQSEAKLKQIKTKSGVKEVVDFNHLTCKHHVYMCIGTFLACNLKSSSVVIIGLGGGGLCSFLHKILRKTQIIGVDIDEEMLKVAVNWFGLVKDNNLKTIIMDGVQFLRDECEKKSKFNAILFDVDSKDTTIGMSCPPKQFLEDETLDNVAKLIGNEGYFIVNLVLRDENLRPEIIRSLSEKFQTIVAYKLEEDLNEIFICSSMKNQIKDKLTNTVNEINKIFKRTKVDIVDINGYLNRLEFLK